MKQIELTAQVHDELNAEIKNLIENKYDGKVKKQNVSDIPVPGSGAMIRRDA